MKFIKVGLTGGIASGKSTVSKILEEDYGACIIDADKISKELCEPDQIIHAALKLTFAVERKLDVYFNDDDTLNRKALAKLMFTNKEAKYKIESMMHRHIVGEIHLRIGQAFVALKHFVVVDAPLLIEAGLHKEVGKVIVVNIEPEEQLKRLVSRNNFSKEEAMLRINAQMTADERNKYADFIIDNNGDIEELKLNIKHVVEQL